MSKELSNLVNSLSEQNFKIFIKKFNQKKYKTEEVRITDGPYDGGNDLEIFVDGKDIKRNIQITVQKTGLDLKIKKDVEKAADNVKSHKYLSNLDFYVSQNIAKDSRESFITNAEIQHSITLRIFDGNYFGEELESHEDLISVLYGLHNIPVAFDKHFDKNTKIVFDVLTHNSETVEIKKNFISSFIFSYLFSNPNSTLDAIYSFINPQLNNSLDRQYFEKEFNYLKSKQIIIGNKEEKTNSLSSEKYDEILKVYNEVTAQETLLLNSLEVFLQSRSLSIEIGELISFLYKIYQENYNIDIEEVKGSNNSYSGSLKKSLQDLIIFFEKKLIPQKEANEIAKELIELCSKNTFLNKLSTVHLFTNLFNSDKLEKYINSREQEIYIDTQILIRLLCVLYPKNYEFKDLALHSVKVLFNTLEKYAEKISLLTSLDYIGEVTNHLTDAVKLKRFLELPYIESLGTSKNVFYNTYLELKAENIIDSQMTFLEFISELLDIEVDILENEKTYHLTSVIQLKIKEFFEYLNFEFIYHPEYQNFSRVKRTYEMDLVQSSKLRSPNAINNDLRTILYLSDIDNHINSNGEVEEPYLVTWDTAFYSIRKKIINDIEIKSNFWYIYSPMKLVDRLSVMNFNLNPESINLNIIALAENNFNYSAKNAAFIDVINAFFNAEDVSKLGIIRRLSSLNNKAKELENVGDKDFSEEEESPILKILSDLRFHYSNDSEYQFKDIVSVFETKDFENTIMTILQTNLNNVNYKRMYEEFDELIRRDQNII